MKNVSGAPHVTTRMLFWATPLMLMIGIKLHQNGVVSRFLNVLCVYECQIPAFRPFSISGYHATKDTLYSKFFYHLELSGDEVHLTEEVHYY